MATNYEALVPTDQRLRQAARKPDLNYWSSAGWSDALGVPTDNNKWARNEAIGQVATGLPGVGSQIGSLLGGKTGKSSDQRRQEHYTLINEKFNQILGRAPSQEDLVNYSNAIFAEQINSPADLEAQLMNSDEYKNRVGGESELEQMQKELIAEQMGWIAYQRDRMEKEIAASEAEAAKIKKEREDAQKAEEMKLKSRGQRRLALTETGDTGVLSPATTGRKKVLGN